MPKRLCWLQPDDSVAVRVKRSNHQVRNPCQRLMRTENLGESSVVTWPSGITPYLKREDRTCGYVSMRPRNGTVGHVWAEGPQVGNIDGIRVLELLQERWMAVFGRMHTLRTDPEGGMAQQGSARKTERHVVLDLHPGEASWKASVFFQKNELAKDTMTRIALERPDLKSTEVLPATVLAQNEMERVRGFALAQLALGRSPNWDHSELSGTSAGDGNSQRCVAESTQ